MKVALIFYSLTVKGGGPRQMLELAKYLASKGEEVIVYTVEYNGTECFPEFCKDLTIKSLYTDPKSFSHYAHNVSLKQQLKNFINILRLGILIAKDDVEIINPHEWPANWAACVAKFLGKNKKVSIVWMCNDLWHIYNPYLDSISLNFKFRRWIDILITNHFINEIIVLDERIKKLVSKYYKREAVVIRSGIDINRFKSFRSSSSKVIKIRESLNIPSNSILILSLSIFYPQRRFEDVVLAINQLVNQEKIKEDFQYIIIGSNKQDPSYYYFIQSLITKYKLDKYIKTITNPIGEKDLLNYYDACDIFVFPNDKQTWGLAVIEAMALGKPCIVSKGSGVHEVLNDEENAFLVPPRDPASISKKLKKLIQNPQLRNKVGDKAKQFVFANFSWEKYSSEMLQQFYRYVS